jgi:regulator of RNase E activity RraA
MPAVSAGLRAEAWGRPAYRPVEVRPETFDKLRRVSVATLTSQLTKNGIRDTFIRGIKPTRPDLRMVGYAFTLRWVAAREDMQEPKENVQRQAVETVSHGDVLVMEARGDLGAATLGDILAQRAAARGAAGVVTDGCFRDSPGFAGIDLPAYYRAPHSGTFRLSHFPLETNVPITCGGVLVLPGDVVVGDAEGVVVIPAALAERVADGALEQELAEEFAFQRVRQGESIVGLYPLSDERRPEFEAWLAESEAPREEK